jgi:hypothetical protein
MSNELFRSPIKAKNKTVRIVSTPFENVIEFTASSSGGTVNTVATAPASLNVTLNGTSYRIALHS